MTFRTQIQEKKFGKKCFRTLQGTMSHRPLTNTSSLKIAAAYSPSLTQNFCDESKSCLCGTEYKYIQSTTVYVPRRNWDSSTPSLASECAPPPGTKGGGEGTLACGWGVRESKFRGLEKKKKHSILPTLCCVVTTNSSTPTCDSPDPLTGPTFRVYRQNKKIKPTHNWKEVQMYNYSEAWPALQ
jgi:hypothetical protein